MRRARGRSKDLPFVTICAMLMDAGITDPKKMLDVRRWYVKRVIQHPRDSEGELQVRTPGQSLGEFGSDDDPDAITPQEEWRNVLRERGYPEHMIEHRIREAFAVNMPHMEGQPDATVSG